ncbi:hypothetical protein EWM64_g4410 [Hericium alpestre]|uniref:Major facilitator superfamily (MFS) profile domain-containing protein n=1 Tax=Hericium alpestre TaxID=135208 RepID=A0A4Y9ZZW9_9AGAM|nr:hypothetical protein EWM64_g4410 [Hericium alpestre]
MGGAPIVDRTSSKDTPFAHLIDTSRSWWKNSRLVKLNFWIALLLITSSANGYDAGFAKCHPTKNIGSLAGYPFVPYMTDGMGRRFTILFGIIFMMAATVIQTASQSVEMFIGARHALALDQRSQAHDLIIQVFDWFWFDFCELGGSTVGHRDRVPESKRTLDIGIQYAVERRKYHRCVDFIQIFFIWFMPESPRWLVSKGRDAEALRILAYYHARGNEKDPLVEFEYGEIKAADKLDHEVNANVGWLSLVKTPGNRKRMRIIIAIAFFSQWSGNGLISYYLNKVLDGIGITSSTIQLLIQIRSLKNAVLNVWSLVLAVTAGFLCDRFGRRRLFISSTIGMTLTWTALTVCTAMYAQHGNQAAAHAVIAMIILHSATYVIAFLPLIVSYTVEILPYPIRAKGFTVFGFAVSVSLIFNQYVNPIALDKLGWKYYLVYVFWNAFEAVFCYLYVIETRHRSLEETAALFDGAEAVAQLTERAAEKAGREPNSDGSEKEKGSITEIEVVEKA